MATWEELYELAREVEETSSFTVHRSRPSEDVEWGWSVTTDAAYMSSQISGYGATVEAARDDLAATIHKRARKKIDETERSLKERQAKMERLLAVTSVAKKEQG